VRVPAGLDIPQSLAARGSFNVAVAIDRDGKVMKWRHLGRLTEAERRAADQIMDHIVAFKPAIGEDDEPMECEFSMEIQFDSD